MSFRPLVSCIIPVYNAEQYLDQGILSLLNQTYEKLEIILVDDQSTDDSWKICQKYATEYSNILAFRNEKNAGAPLRSRERGIRESHGEWLTFMDCDDYVRPKYIENLVKTTANGRYDIAVTGHSRLYSDGRIEDFLWEDYSQTTDERLAVFYKHLFEHDFWTDPTDTVGQNLIRASVCRKADLSKYSNMVFAEDTLMALVFLANSQNGVNFVDHHDFMWRQREGSGSHGGFSSRANQPEFYAACLDILHEKGLYDRISTRLPLVSIVVPVYNVARYLKECLDSIKGQTYRNIEIIIVNDGSTDDSQIIIDEYKISDHRVTGIVQDNQGLNMARATGVKAASGEYISFVDSDDAIHEDYIKILFENLLTNNVDISVCGYQKFEIAEELENKIITPNYAEQVLRNKPEIIDYYLGESHSISNVFPMSAWGKLYRAEVIENTDWEFSNYRRNEDNFETLQWYSGTSRGIAVISVPLYYYRLNPKSITATPQYCVTPEGKKINYFEYLQVLYVKTKEYLGDDRYDLAVINQLAQTNSIQARNFIENDWLDKEALNSAVDNWGELIKIYNEQIQLRDATALQKQQEIAAMSESFSWRVTAPLRRVKNFVRSLRR